MPAPPLVANIDRSDRGATTPLAPLAGPLELATLNPGSDRAA